MFKIEKDIPVPKSSGKGGLIYPFAEMNIGESFLVPSTKISAAAGAARLRGFKVKTRKENETEHRIWRIA